MRPRGESDAGATLGCLFTLALLAGAGWLGYRYYEQKSFEEYEANYRALKAERDAQLELDICLGNAERHYWDYVKLNGREVKGKPGTWSAATHVWDTAAANKRNDIAACELRHVAK